MTRLEKRALSAPTSGQRREARFLLRGKERSELEFDARVAAYPRKPRIKSKPTGSAYALKLLVQRKAARAARQARKETRRCR